MVKLFPGDVGGPGYLKAIKEPLPQIEIMPTKGVDFNTAATYIKAGAVALVSKALIDAKNFAQITANAEKFNKPVRDVK